MDESEEKSPLGEASSSSPPPTEAVVTDDDVPDSKVCGSLCSMIKSQLIKLHEEVVRRFGHFEAEEGEATSACSLHWEPPTTLPIGTDLAAADDSAEALKSPVTPLTPGSWSLETHWPQ